MATTSPHMLGIDPKLYRHFAIGTIAIAVIVAVFSSGGSQATMSQNQQYAELKKAEEAKFGKTKMVDNRDESAKQRAANSAFAAEPGPSMDGGSFGNSGDSGYSAPSVAGPERMTVLIEPNQALMAKMTPDQRKKYLKDLQDKAKELSQKGPYQPTEQQIEAITASSAARSGPPNSD